MACHNDDFESVKHLLKNPRIDVNISEGLTDNNTALHFATKHNNIAIVELLLAHKDIDPNQKNNQGKTALDLAEENNLEKITRILENFKK